MHDASHALFPNLNAPFQRRKTSHALEINLRPKVAWIGALFHQSPPLTVITPSVLGTFLAHETDLANRTFWIRAWWLVAHTHYFGNVS